MRWRKTSSLCLFWLISFQLFKIERVGVALNLPLYLSKSLSLSLPTPCFFLIWRLITNLSLIAINAVSNVRLKLTAVRIRRLIFFVHLFPIALAFCVYVSSWLIHRQIAPIVLPPPHHLPSRLLTYRRVRKKDRRRTDRHAAHQVRTKLQHWINSLSWLHPEEYRPLIRFFPKHLMQ